MKLDDNKVPTMLHLVKVAYRRLKSFVYNQPSNLALRIDLSRFESSEDFKQKLFNLAIALEKIQKSQQEETFKDFLSQISFDNLPKKFEPHAKRDVKGSPFFYTNKPNIDKISVTKAIAFIKCPIELHIVSVLWIMKIGCKIDESIGSQAYANRLTRDKEDDTFPENGLALFEPYFHAYKSWRDNALRLTKTIHEQKLDASIISLDIKEYYDSVDLDLSQVKLPEDIDKSFLFLNDLLHRIHLTYSNKRGRLNKILPIGLLSSAILANYCLKDFDESINSELRPAYYGRYVDDLLMVVTNPPSQHEDTTQFLEDLFLGSETITFNKNDNTWKLKSANGEFVIQNEKFKIFSFAGDKPISLLEDFERKIRETSSEFKLLMEDDEILDKFTSQSIKIAYSDSFNKIRSVEDFLVDRWGASVHLESLLNTTKSTTSLTDSEFIKIEKQIYDFFATPAGLEFYPLWEKVFTFFVINKKGQPLVKFGKELILNISRIHSKVPNISSHSLQISMMCQLANCFAMAVALNLEFLREDIFQSLRERVDSESFTKKLKVASSNLFEELTKQIVEDLAKSLIKSNLFRHRYCFYPLLNFCDQEDNFSFTDYGYIEKANFKLADNRLKWSPRFIHFHELTLFHSLKRMI